MRRLLAVLICGALLFPVAWAEEEELSLSAQCAVLIDAESGRILYEKNANELRPIASVTKLMTALVVVSACDDLDELVTVTAAESGTEGTSLYLKAGEEISVETLLYGLLMESGNDAAMVLARHTAGDVELFVDWMNQRASALGMTNTRFVNPSGLPGEGQYSTAYDVAILGRAVLEHEILSRIVATRSMTKDERHFSNHNKLLQSYEGCIGLKTGYTDDAGRTLASAARREGQTLIAVTLKASDDWNDHAAMLDYGFAHYPRTRLVQGGREFRAIEVRGSIARLVRVVPNTSLYYPLASDERVRMEIELPNWVQAPLQAGGIAGSMRFYLDDEPIGHSYLIFETSIADNTVKNGIFSFFRNLVGYQTAAESFAMRFVPYLPEEAVTVSLPSVRKNYYEFSPYG